MNFSKLERLQTTTPDTTSPTNRVEPLEPPSPQPTPQPTPSPQNLPSPISKGPVYCCN